MDDQGYSEEELIKFLLSDIKCIVCQHRYEPRDVRILAHHDQSWFLAMTCSHCGTQSGVLAVIEEIEGSELTLEEEFAFQQMPPIDADDVLDIHELLRDFNGDFKDLFNE